MAKSKKEKKLARRERQEQLKSASASIQERLLANASAGQEEDEVEYVLDDALADAKGTAPLSAGSAGDANGAADGHAEDGAGDEEGDADRVELPAASGSSGSARALKTSKKGTGVHVGRKHHRMSWQALKLAVTDRYGPEAAEVVSEHDGNAEDPLFTVLLKMQPHTVPVPRHWDRLRPFMSLQSDREEAVDLIPAEIQALGVDKLRAAKDKRANPDQIAFMTCFITGTPLQRRTFGVELSRFGDVFSEGKWMPKAHFEPGRLTQRLRQALGMGPNAPPPWLYSMQTMRRLPPAYPGLRVPGLNAPIPAGAQWGRGQGQWGEPPRGENNMLLFPSLMDEAAATAASTADRLWGAVPLLQTEQTEDGVDGERSGPAAPPPPPASSNSAPAASAAPSAAAAAAAARVTINPTAFRPQAYQPQRPAAGQYVSTTPQEYVRVMDRGNGGGPRGGRAAPSVAVGHKMVLKSTVAAPGPSQQRQQPQPMQQTKAPARPGNQPPPNSRGKKF